MADCSACHKPNPEHAKFCQYCGATQAAPAGDPACASCGKPNPPGRKFCAGCGTRLQAAASPTPEPVLAASPAINCPHCSAVNDAKRKFCAQCGGGLQATAAAVEPAPVTRVEPEITEPAAPATLAEAPQQSAAEAVPVVEPAPVTHVEPEITEPAAPATLAEAPQQPVAEVAEPVAIAVKTAPAPTLSVFTQEKASDPQPEPAQTKGDKPSSRKWIYLAAAGAAGVLVAVAGVMLSSRMPTMTPTTKGVNASAPAAQAPQTLAPGTHIVDSKDASEPAPLPPLKQAASAPAASAPASDAAPLVPAAPAAPEKPVRQAAPNPEPPMPPETDAAPVKKADSKVHEAKSAEAKKPATKADNSVEALRKKKEELLKQLRQSN